MLSWTEDDAVESVELNEESPERLELEVFVLVKLEIPVERGVTLFCGVTEIPA
jgi:hypothetical protein